MAREIGVNPGNNKEKWKFIARDRLWVSRSKITKRKHQRKGDSN